jgi:hypothetical protein
LMPSSTHDYNIHQIVTLKDPHCWYIHCLELIRYPHTLEKQIRFPINDHAR